LTDSLRCSSAGLVLMSLPQYAVKIFGRSPKLDARALSQHRGKVAARASQSAHRGRLACRFDTAAAPAKLWPVWHQSSMGMADFLIFSAYSPLPRPFSPCSKVFSIKYGEEKC
jgi:hypothetical protein